MKSSVQTEPYHILAKKVKPLESPHCLGAGLNVSEDHVSLSPHLHRFHGDDIENGAIGREKGVETEPQVGFPDLVR